MERASKQCNLQPAGRALREQDLLMRLSVGSKEGMSQAPSQKWRKMARYRETLYLEPSNLSVSPSVCCLCNPLTCMVSPAL